MTPVEWGKKCCGIQVTRRGGTGLGHKYQQVKNN